MKNTISLDPNNSPPTKEEIILDYLLSPNNRRLIYGDTAELQTLEVTNHSSNDFYRDPTPEEIQNLVNRYLHKDPS